MPLGPVRSTKGAPRRRIVRSIWWRQRWRAPGNGGEGLCHGKMARRYPLSIPDGGGGGLRRGHWNARTPAGGGCGDDLRREGQGVQLRRDHGGCAIGVSPPPRPGSTTVLSRAPPVTVVGSGGGDRRRGRAIPDHEKAEWAVDGMASSTVVWNRRLVATVAVVWKRRQWGGW